MDDDPNIKAVPDDGSFGTSNSDGTSLVPPLLGELQRFENFVEELEAMARALKAIKQRTQFHVVN